jgi:hypothetical protein
MMKLNTITIIFVCLRLADILGKTIYVNIKSTDSIVRTSVSEAFCRLFPDDNFVFSTMVEQGKFVEFPNKNSYESWSVSIEKNPFSNETNDQSVVVLQKNGEEAIRECYKSESMDLDVVGEMDYPVMSRFYPGIDWNIRFQNPVFGITGRNRSLEDAIIRGVKKLGEKKEE